MCRWSFPMLCCHQESRRSLPNPMSPWVSPSFPSLPGLRRSSSHLFGIFPLVLLLLGARGISITSPWDISPRSFSARCPGNLLHVSLPLLVGTLRQATSPTSFTGSRVFRRAVLSLRPATSTMFSRVSPSIS